MGTKRWCVAVGMVVLVAAGCGDDDGDDGADAIVDGGEADTGPSDAGEPDAFRTDAGLPPADETESETDSNDPYLGSAAPTGLDIGEGFDGWSVAGTIATDQANEAWADSDGYAFRVSAPTLVRAELDHRGEGSLRAVAILRANKEPVAWWSMSAREPALSNAVELEPGDYLLHVSAALPAPAVPEPYVASIVVAPAPCEPAARTADHAETEAAGARTNDAVALTLLTFPELVTAAASAEASGVAAVAGEARVIEGVLGDVASLDDSYLDRDVYTFTADGTEEVEVVVESAADDVDVDVVVLREAGSGPGEIVATGLALGRRIARVVFGTEPGASYRLWVATRDESDFPGAGASLPMAYRATVCGR